MRGKMRKRIEEKKEQSGMESQEVVDDWETLIAVFLSQLKKY
jgi:hypothetical protein